MLLNGVTVALTLPKQHPPHVAFTLERWSDFPEGCEIKYHRDGSAYVYLQDHDGNTIEFIYWLGDKK